MLDYVMTNHALDSVWGDPVLFQILTNIVLQRFVAYTFSQFKILYRELLAFLRSHTCALSSLELKPTKGSEVALILRTGVKVYHSLQTVKWYSCGSPAHKSNQNTRTRGHSMKQSGRRFQMDKRRYCTALSVSGIHCPVIWSFSPAQGFPGIADGPLWKIGCWTRWAFWPDPAGWMLIIST